MADEKKKLIFMVTHGPETPEMATIPFVMANTALASDMDVVMGFQGNGAFLVQKGVAEHVAAHGFPALKDLLTAFQQAGGKMYLCSPCAGSRMITEADLVDGVEFAGAATFVAECATATNVMVY